MMSEQMTKEEREEIVKKKIFDMSLKKAAIWGTGGGVFAGGLTALALYKSKSFGKTTSYSARVATPIMLSLFLFGLQFELTTLYASRNPQVRLTSRLHSVENSS
jgi:hypothetical protein